LLIGASALAGAVGAAALLSLKLSRTGPNIEATTVYPGAADVQIQHSKVRTPVHTVQGGTRAQISTSQGSSISGSISYKDVYHGTMTFSTVDSPKQVYGFYEVALTRAGWTSLVAQGVQDPPPNSPPGIGLSGPRTYSYDPAPPWLKRLTDGNIGGVVAFMSVQAQATSTIGGSKVSIILYRDW
jgi:hypothetical protein